MTCKLSSLALGMVLCFAAASVCASEADLQKQIDAQQRSMLEMQNRITELTTQVNTLRGDLEALRYEVARIPAGAPQSPAANQDSTAGSQTAAVQDPAAAAPEGPPKPNAADEALKPVDAAAQHAYDTAYDHVLNNRLDAAIPAFDSYLQSYPDNVLTPNAWYWLGQVQYRQNKLDDARVSFLNVARFNSSTKRPDAIYKLGLISKMRGENDKAVAYFNLVINTYPADTSSDLARKELLQL